MDQYFSRGADQPERPAMAHPAPPATVIPFMMPPVTHDRRGRWRTVGIEIEFTGPTAAETARALRAAFGGAVRENDPHAFRLMGSSIGDMSVELDSRMVHPAKTGKGGAILPRIAAWFGSAARVLIPCEIVTAPLPLNRLHEAERVLDVLRGLGAKGTQDGALYAFGLHFNPQVPAEDAATVVAHLKSFVLLNAWLRRQVAPDATRSVLGFADPFPAAYTRHLVAPDYWPDLTTFIDDYLAANPTRNRDLDLLPLLLHLDPDRVRRALPNEKINARPTFHYRLPDARVSDPGWSLAPDWNRWVSVERLACDRDRLMAAGQAYLGFAGEEKSWADVADGIVHS
ncbi:amidoligase family protein [Microvirga pudoricolor]|uniref:amidoligase family protein n=1 Tax=Microvirga pudoricolor TaxID=2778729 RepID=UPI00194EFD81|nr:amidoligase family protein [Microvirga pudoricolor]MBM6593484.1 amidoligase family protein [Microvirga pudoricolor]